MAIKRKFFGAVNRGKIIFDNIRLLKEVLFTLEGKEIELTIDKKRKKRTLPQNDFYFGVVVEILRQELGYGKEEMHEALKCEFLMDYSKALPYPRSTTTLSTEEFWAYIEEIQRWASDFHSIDIPDPEKVDYRKETNGE